MNTHAKKTRENKKHSQKQPRSESIVNTVAQKQSSSTSTYKFEDNRPEAVAQRNLQEMANNSPKAKQVTQLQAMASENSAQQQLRIQKTENNSGFDKETEVMGIKAMQRQPDAFAASIQRMVIQRHALDDDVLNGSLEDVINRIEAIAQGKDERGPKQDRVTDLWKKQGELMNQLRSDLSGTVEDSEEAQELNEILAGFTPRLALAKFSFSMQKIKLPKIPIYESQHGTHLEGGGGGGGSK